VQIVIPTDRETGRPRGFAFVDYDDRAVAERAVQQLHGQPFKGRPLSVSEARPREARPPMGAGGFAGPRPPMGGGPRPMGGLPPGLMPVAASRGGDPAATCRTSHQGRGIELRQTRNQEGKAKGPLKELRSGRMFSVDEDSRFQEDDDLGMADVDLNLKDEEPKDEEPKDEEPKDGE
jgi:RNA recognition motif-containing protein